MKRRLGYRLAKWANRLEPGVFCETIKPGQFRNITGLPQSLSVIQLDPDVVKRWPR